MIQYWLLGVMIHYSGQLVNIVFLICIISYIPKRNYNKNNKKNIFNKNGRRCKDVKTQKAREQGWEANIGTKLNKPLSYNPT